MENRIVDILIVIMLLIIITLPFLSIYLTIANINKTKQINLLQEKINSLEFEKSYLEFVYEDNKNQWY